MPSPHPRRLHLPAAHCVTLEPGRGAAQRGGGADRWRRHSGGRGGGTDSPEPQGWAGREPAQPVGQSRAEAALAMLAGSRIPSAATPPAQAMCGFLARTPPRGSRCLCGRGCTGLTCSEASRASRTSDGSRWRGCARPLGFVRLSRECHSAGFATAVCSDLVAQPVRASGWTAHCCHAGHAKHGLLTGTSPAAVECGQQERDPGGRAGPAGLPKGAGPEPRNRWGLAPAHAGTAQHAHRSAAGLAGGSVRPPSKTPSRKPLSHARAYLPPACAAGEIIIVSNGKFGPFLRCGALSRSIPKASRRTLGPPGGGQLWARRVWNRGSAAHIVSWAGAAWALGGCPASA